MSQQLRNIGFEVWVGNKEVDHSVTSTQNITGVKQRQALKAVPALHFRTPSNILTVEFFHWPFDARSVSAYDESCLSGLSVSQRHLSNVFAILFVMELFFSLIVHYTTILINYNFARESDEVVSFCYKKGARWKIAPLFLDLILLKALVGRNILPEVSATVAKGNIWYSILRRVLSHGVRPGSQRNLDLLLAAITQDR